MCLDDYASIVVQSCLLMQRLALQLVYNNIECVRELALQHHTLVHV